MKKLLLAIFALSLLTACSSEAPKSGETSKPQPKPPEILTARSALQKLYISAHGWGADARPYRLESTANADSNGRDGKSAIWHAGFASSRSAEIAAATAGAAASAEGQTRACRTGAGAARSGSRAASA